MSMEATRSDPVPARFKDLCIDARDVTATAVFWAEVLGLAVESSGENVRLTGPTPQHTVWVNDVPESRSVKQRVHLDVFGRDLTELTTLGATVVEAFDRWTVLADPEGGEVCLFERNEVPPYRLYEVVVDCVAAEPIARWWAAAWGAKLGHVEPDPWWWVEAIPGAPFESVVFVEVPEPKTVKNRIHWDVTAGSTELLLAAGAALVRGRDTDTSWDVLADPEGNEFCVFTD